MALTPVQQLQAELDSLLEDYLEALDQYQQGVARLSEHLKAGHMNLARAKVALGPGRVGPAKYDLTERASNKIVCVRGFPFPWLRGGRAALGGRLTQCMMHCRQ
ncbi:hypothetical protein JCM8202v2_002837 [Rhodotorula sphaerocarpa]